MISHANAEPVRTKPKVQTQFSSSAIEKVLYGSPLATKAKPKTPKVDYQRLNRLSLKKLQQEKHAEIKKQEELKQVQKAKAVEAKKEKFGHVKSKLYEFPKEPEAVHSKRSSLSATVTSSAVEGPPKYPTSETVYLPPTNRTLPKGELPLYLLRRKQDLVDQQERKMKSDLRKVSGYKDGHRLLTADERSEIVKLLEKEMDEIRRAMRQVANARTRKDYDKKCDFESRIEAIENQLDKLSTPGPIWVKDESEKVDSVQDIEGLMTRLRTE